MAKAIHKQDLIRQLSKKNRRPQEHYRAALDEILEGIQGQLSEGREVILTGFGTFYTRTRKAGKGLNFKTKKPMEYKAVRQGAFRVGTLLKQAIRRKKGLFSR
jgi:DNA-binding protein HU-beta